MPENEQFFPPIGPIRNSELFSNHWLDTRLPLEPDWHELLSAAEGAADKLTKLWKEQKARVEKFGKAG